MATISGTIPHSITLATSGVYASPLTISGTGGVIASTGNAIFGPNTQAWTVDNQGLVSAANGAGILLDDGGAVINSGTILSPTAYSVLIVGAAGFLTNSQSGYIGSGGIALSAGGTILNAGRIVDMAGAGVLIGVGTVTNTGTITGATSGVDLAAGGTVVDSGTITGGGGGTAIVFGGTGANRLVLGPGYHLGGVAVGSTAGGATNTLELASAASAGTASAALATEFVNFGTVTVDAGAQWALTGNSSLSGITLIDLGSLTNAGSLTAANVTVAGAGYLDNTGRIGTNGGGSSVIEQGGVSTIVNSGTMLSNEIIVTVAFAGNGALTNSQSGYIGSGGVRFAAGGTVANAGRIVGAVGPGVYLDGVSNTVSNTGTITGATFGVNLAAGGTVVDSGTISGASGTAVSFGGTGSNLLVLQHGYHLNGVVFGSSSATSTVELAGSIGAPVTVTANGLGLTNFQDVLFGTGGNDALAVTIASGTLPVTLSGFTLSGDIVDLTGLAFAGTTSVGFNPVTNMLKVTEGAASVTIQLDSENYSGIAWTAQDDGTGGTDIAPVCFCRGTMILTEHGEVPVEALMVGDCIETLSGALKRIRWIGIGRDLVTHANKLSRPVIVRASALADGVPKRDLYLTHGHALYLEGALIPVENLVNHRTILWDEAARVVEYYHIELEDHDAVFAEGAAAESYYDASNRARFHNTRPASAAGGEKAPFAPVLSGGELVERVWHQLFARAGGEIASDTTDDPDLHLLVDGRRLDPAAAEGCTYRFSLTMPPASALAICSRSGVPSLLGISAHDHRRLGVALARIALQQPGVATTFEHDAPLLVEAGCHPAQRDYVWTDGELALPAHLFAHLQDAFTLTLHIERPGMRYALQLTTIKAAA